MKPTGRWIIFEFEDSRWIANSMDHPGANAESDTWLNLYNKMVESERLYFDKMAQLPNHRIL